MALPVGFAGASPPDAWPRPRSAPRPERLDASVETLEGVGPTLARRLAKLGLTTVGDVLWQPPRRYEEPAPSRRICDLFGDEEAVIEGVVRSRDESAARQAQDPHGARGGRLGRDQGDVVQPALAREQARPGHADPHPRSCEPARLRRLLLRPRRRIRDGRARARVPGDRGGRPEAPSRPPRAGARARAGRRRGPARQRARGRAAPATRRRARRGARSELAPGGRGGAHPSRLRRAPRPPARACSDGGGARARVGRAARAPGGAHRAVSRVAAVRAHS